MPLPLDVWLWLKWTIGPPTQLTCTPKQAKCTARNQKSRKIRKKALKISIAYKIQFGLWSQSWAVQKRLNRWRCRLSKVVDLGWAEKKHVTDLILTECHYVTWRAHWHNLANTTDWTARVQRRCGLCQITFNCLYLLHKRMLFLANVNSICCLVRR